MGEIAIARAAHLFVYTDLLREIGAPIERELVRSKLPSAIEQMPDAFVCVQFALDFVLRSARDAPVAELGFLAAQRTTLDILHRNFRQALQAAIGGPAKFGALVHEARRENTALVAGIVRESSAVRVICDLAPFRNHPAVAYAEWLINQVLLSIGYSTFGRVWRPLEMTFMARDAVCDAAREAFGNCRLLEGQPHTSILLPIEQLHAPPASRPASPRNVNALPRGGVICGSDLVSTLRLAISPYLTDGSPDIGLAAEIAGLSRRTLQRELARSGRTYSGIVREARFDAACALLGDPAFKIIDVAFETGYANPQHFSRAFRQLAGMSPRAYRKHCIAARDDQLGVA